MTEFSVSEKELVAAVSTAEWGNEMERLIKEGLFAYDGHGAFVAPPVVYDTEHDAWITDPVWIWEWFEQDLRYHPENKFGRWPELLAEARRINEEATHCNLQRALDLVLTQGSAWDLNAGEVSQFLGTSLADIVE